MENLFSVQHLWVYTSQCVDKAEALSNQSSRSWLLVLKNNKKTKPFAAWLLAHYAAESVFFRDHGPPPTVQCGVFAGNVLFLAPQEHLQHPAPWRQGFSWPMDICFSSEGLEPHFLSWDSPPSALGCLPQVPLHHFSFSMVPAVPALCREG